MNWLLKNACRPIVLLGTYPQTSGLNTPKFGQPNTFCDAEQRFLLLFLEKEENTKPIGHSRTKCASQGPGDGFAEV
jgi:hypothetical protein